VDCGGRALPVLGHGGRHVGERAEGRGIERPWGAPAPRESMHDVMPGPPTPSVHLKLVATRSVRVNVWLFRGEVIGAVGAVGARVAGASTVYWCVTDALSPSLLVAVTVKECRPEVAVSIGLPSATGPEQVLIPDPCAPSVQL
jgi:hypothetical protein